MRRVGREPDDSGGSFSDRAGRAFAAHVGADPAGTDAIYGALRQGRGELNGDAVKRRLRNAVGGGPAISAVFKLAAAAGDIHDARFTALLEQRRERLRDEPGTERVCAQGRFENLGRDSERVLVVVEKDAGVVDQHIQPIARA